MSKSLDETLSREISQRINSKAKDYFNNAHKAALLTEGATYVQGFLVYSVTPCKILEYAWIEQGDCLIDPSFPHLNKNAQELHYFAAQRLSVKQLKAAIEEAQEDYPEDAPLPVYGAAPYDYYGDAMLGGAEYTSAYHDATAICNQLNGK